MANFVGSLALTTTGSHSFNIGFQPSKLVFKVGAKGGASAVQTLSLGAVDQNGNQNVITEYDDHAGNYTYNTDQSNCIWVEKHTTVWGDDLKAAFTAFTANGFTLNVATANSNYAVFVEAE